MKKAINIIIAALVVVSMVAHVAGLVSGNGNLSLNIIDVTMAALCILVLYYNFCGYKKPHGNLLRYTFFIFGFATIITSFIIGKPDLFGLILIIAGTIIVYMSGRLNKIEKNKILTIVVLILFVARAILNVFHIDVSFEAAQSVATEMPQVDPSTMPAASNLTILGVFASPSIWIALALAYTSRYKAHKEAGLEDKPNA